MLSLDAQCIVRPPSVHQGADPPGPGPRRVPGPSREEPVCPGSPGGHPPAVPGTAPQPGLPAAGPPAEPPGPVGAGQQDGGLPRHPLRGELRSERVTWDGIEYVD